MENIDLVWPAVALILLLSYLILKKRHRRGNIIIVTTSTLSLMTGFVGVAIVGLITVLLLKQQ